VRDNNVDQALRPAVRPLISCVKRRSGTA